MYMGKIEVGEYVRTNKGRIGKVVEIRLGFNKDLQLYQDIYKLDNGLWTILDYIVKHSKQLEDMIEVNDIVNRYRILDIYEATTTYEERILDIGYGQAIFNDEIKTILTKEQFEANCYKVGGEDETSND